MRRIHVTIAAVAMVSTLALAACGSDDDSAGDTPASSSLAPEDIKVPDSTVTAGLTQAAGHDRLGHRRHRHARGGGQARCDPGGVGQLRGHRPRHRHGALPRDRGSARPRCSDQIEDGDAEAATATRRGLVRSVQPVPEPSTRDDSSTGAGGRRRGGGAGLPGGASQHRRPPQRPAATMPSKQVQNVRVSIDLTLSLIKQGTQRGGVRRRRQRLPQPLRAGRGAAADHRQRPDHRHRGSIRRHPAADPRRRPGRARFATSWSSCAALLDTIERKLTATGAAAPALIFAQSFLIIFREGFEVVLLVSILLGYLEAARSTAFIRPILIGIGLACVATVLTVIVLATACSSRCRSRSRCSKGSPR